MNGILSSSPVDWHTFCANWVKGEVYGHVHKLEARALGCRPQGVKPKEQHITPNLQDSVNMRCTMEC